MNSKKAKRLKKESKILAKAGLNEKIVYDYLKKHTKGIPSKK